LVHGGDLRFFNLQVFYSYMSMLKFSINVILFWSLTWKPQLSTDK